MLETLPPPGFGQIRDVRDIVASTRYTATIRARVRTPRHHTTTSAPPVLALDQLRPLSVLHVPQTLEPQPERVMGTSPPCTPVQAYTSDHTRKEGR